MTIRCCIRWFPHKLAFACALAFIATSVARGQTEIFSYDFEKLSPGPLSEHDEWFAQNETITPLLYPGPSGSLNSTIVVGGNPDGKALAYKEHVVASGTLSTRDTLILSFDVYEERDHSIEAFGIGSSYAYYGLDGGQSPIFGLFNGIWMIRPENNGEIANALSADGSPARPIVGHWYTVQSKWDLAAGTATLAIKDLTAGAKDFTPLYFDAGQKEATRPLGFKSPQVPDWNTVYVRETAGMIGGYMDNLHVVRVAR